MPQFTSRRIVRGVVVAAAALLLPALSSCMASYGATTQEPYNPTNGVRADAGKLQLRSIIGVADSAGRATLVATIVNRGKPDSLVDVTVKGGKAKLAPSPLPLKPSVATRIGTARTGKPMTVVLTGRSVKLGQTVHLTFEFGHNPSASVDALVLPRRGEYASVPVPR